jgi:hypothetical protein
VAQNQSTSNASETIRLGGFEILDKIAEGGMGTVYRARQTSLNRIVAVKFLNPRIAADTEYIESFRREAQAAARLQHPNIVSVIDAGEDGGLYFYAMEIVGGKTLFRWVQRDGALTEPTVIGIGVCVASGLKHAWDKEKLIHRDLKPDNVMVDPDGNVKLCDLGLAKTVGEHSPSDGHVFGTPHYMSPEQARAQAVDFRSDIYSLGMTLYYALTAQVPFQGGDPAEVMKRHLKGQLPDPREFAPKSSPHICRILEKMTAKPIAERYQNWSEVLRDFELAKNGQPPLCKPPASGASTIRINDQITRQRSIPAAPLVIAPTVAAPSQPAAAPTPVIPQPRGSNLPLMIIAIALIIGALGVLIAFWLNNSSAPQSSGDKNSQHGSVVAAPATAAKQWEDAIAFARANEKNPDAIPEFADRLRKITQDFPGSPEANQAQMLLNFIAAQQQAALNAQNNGAPPQGVVQNLNFQPPWQWQQQNGQEPPWMQFVRPFLNNPPPIINWGLDLARRAERGNLDPLRPNAPPDIAKNPDPPKPDDEARRAREKRAQEEFARAKAATDFDARFAKPYLAALSKRDYPAAVETARAAISDPAFKPLRDELKIAEDGARRLRQFWKSLPQLANTLKGRVIPFRGQSAKIVGADKNEILFEPKPNVSFSVEFSSLSTAEIAALALLATPNPTAENATDGAWFLFAEGRPSDAGLMLDTAQRLGTDTTATRRVMSWLIRGAMETEAETAITALRAAADAQNWDEARIKLAVLNEHYARTKAAQAVAPQLKELEGRLKKNAAPKPK